jgi:hypothetical protein
MTATQKTQEVFSDKEVAMLVMMYNNPDANYNTYSLALALHPTEDPSSQEHLASYREVRATTERLVMLDLVDGDRHLDAGREIYFSEMKLTKKGVRKAIEVN